MKKWYESKTVWLNAASVITTIVAAASQALPSLQGLMSLETYLIVNAVVGVANVVLRTYFTSTAIE